VTRNIDVSSGSEKQVNGGSGIRIDDGIGTVTFNIAVRASFNQYAHKLKIL
jgi:hypothetical protein